MKKHDGIFDSDVQEWVFAVSMFILVCFTVWAIYNH